MSESKELSTIVPRSITDVTDIDFEGVFNEAIKIFADQAQLSTKSAAEIDISDLKLSAAKADNFLNALGGMLEISHKVELLAAEKLKFKRKDELDHFNILFEEYRAAAKFIKRQRELCSRQLDRLYKRLEHDELEKEDIDMMNALNDMMSLLMNNMKVVSDGSRKLIEAERKTGGRSFGADKAEGATIAFLERIGSPKGSDDPIDVPGGAGKGQQKPRKLSKEELMQAVDEQSG